MNLRSSILLVGVLCVHLGCKGSQPPPEAAPPAKDNGPQRFVELAPEGMKSADIRTARVTPDAFSPRLKTPASITGDPQRIARVGARVSGRVAKISVALGDQVKRNQPLIEIDAAELHEVSLKYFTAEARAKQAADALARQQQLRAERVGAEQDLRGAEADSAAAEAALREADEHLRFLGLSNADIGRLGRREPRSLVRSPIDGRVAALDVSLGQVLSGTEDVITIAQLDSVWATLQVYERDLASVTPGTPVEIQVPTYPNRSFAGVVTVVADLLDPATHTAQARASLVNADGALRPGMSALALVTLRSDGQVLWLPAEAVQSHEGGSIAFVPVGERRFESRKVVVGLERDGYVPVTSGVKAGDEVVTHGAFALRGELERAELEE